MKIFRFFLCLKLSLLLLSCDKKEKESFIEAEGVVDCQTVVLSSKVQADILEILKEEGSKIEAGDTIMILKSDYIQYQLKIAEANVIAAQAAYELTLKGAREEDIRLAEENLKQAEAVYEQAKTDFNRFEYLLKNNAISEKQAEEARLRFKVAETQYAAALEQFRKIKNIARPEEVKTAYSNLVKAKANAEIIRQNLKDCYVTSPISGFLQKLYVQVGELAAPMSKLCKIADLDNLKIYIYLTETDLAKLKLRQKAKAITNYGKEFAGIISFISNEAQFTPKNILTKDEKQNLVYETIVSVKNQNYELKIGMPVTVIIRTDERNN